MHLSTLVEILERELPETLENESTRDNLARLYAERGCPDAAATLHRARRARPDAASDATAPLPKPARARAR